MKELEADDADWGVQSMAEAYEEECHRLQPFLCHDFGIKLLFGEAECEAMRGTWWYIVDDNVGFQGPVGQTTLCKSVNRFASLFWEKFGLI